MRAGAPKRWGPADGAGAGAGARHRGAARRRGGHLAAVAGPARCCACSRRKRGQAAGPAARRPSASSVSSMARSPMVCSATCGARAG